MSFSNIKFHDTVNSLVHHVQSSVSIWLYVILTWAIPVEIHTPLWQMYIDVPHTGSTDSLTVKLKLTLPIFYMGVYGFQLE